MEIAGVVIDLWVAGAVLFGLACFAWSYDRWVASLEEDGRDRGYMAFIVSIGCAVTVLGYTIIVRSLVHGLILLACFLASGIPMIVGDVRRYVCRRHQDEQQVKEQVRKSYDQ